MKESFREFIYAQTGPGARCIKCGEQFKAGQRIVCRTWRTPTMAAPAFEYSHKSCPAVPFSAEGRYLILAEDKHGHLDVSLTELGREELCDIEPNTRPDFDIFADLFEDFNGNGWALLTPENVGALTACQIIISPDVDYLEGGTVLVRGPVYWHERYQIEDFAEQLRDRGTCKLLRASE